MAVGLASFSVVVVVYGVMVLPESSQKQWNHGNFATVFMLYFNTVSRTYRPPRTVGYMELGVDSWMTKLMENLLLIPS